MKIKIGKKSSHFSLPYNLLDGLSSKKEIVSKLSSITESDIYEYFKINVNIEWEEEVYGEIKKRNSDYYIHRRPGLKNEDGVIFADVTVYDEYTDHDVTSPNGSGDDDWHNYHSWKVEFIRLCFGDIDPNLLDSYHIDDCAEDLTKWFQENPEYLTSCVKEILDEVKESE